MHPLSIKNTAMKIFFITTFQNMISKMHIDHIEDFFILKLQSSIRKQKTPPKRGFFWFFLALIYINAHDLIKLRQVRTKCKSWGWNGVNRTNLSLRRRYSYFYVWAAYQRTPLPPGRESSDLPPHREPSDAVSLSCWQLPAKAWIEVPRERVTRSIANIFFM